MEAKAIAATLEPSIHAIFIFLHLVHGLSELHRLWDFLHSAHALPLLLRFFSFFGFMVVLDCFSGWKVEVIVDEEALSPMLSDSWLFEVTVAKLLDERIGWVWWATFMSLFCLAAGEFSKMLIMSNLGWEPLSVDDPSWCWCDSVMAVWGVEFWWLGCCSCWWRCCWWWWLCMCGQICVIMLVVLNQVAIFFDELCVWVLFCLILCCCTCFFAAGIDTTAA